MVALSSIQTSGLPSAKGLGLSLEIAPKRPTAQANPAEDQLELSPLARGLSRRPPASPKKLPAFGRFQLGGPEPLPFGPDLNANILNRIPGDGVEEPTHGVRVGHKPVRGLNILA